MPLPSVAVVHTIPARLCFSMLIVSSTCCLVYSVFLTKYRPAMAVHVYVPLSVITLSKAISVKLS